MTTLYYDPLLDLHHRLPVGLALVTSYYAAPQKPDDARLLFEAACKSIGLDATPTVPLRAGRGYGAALLLAREWDMTALEARLVDAIEASYEPTWNEDRTEFTWGMGLDEEHPRGQFNGFLAAAEAGGPGRWTELSAAPVEACPQIVGVDFPTVALSRAEWIDGALYLRLAPQRDDPTAWTSFSLVGAEPRLWYITGIEGATMDVTSTAGIIRVPRVTGDIVLTPGSY